MNPLVLAQASNAAGNVLKSKGFWIAVAVLVVLILGNKWLMPWLRRIFGNVPDDAPYFTGGGDVLASFYRNRSNTIDRLYKTLKKSSVWNDGRCEALREAVGWNDNQLIAISNAFKNKYGKTLYDAVDEVSGDDCGITDFNFYDSQLKDRLSGLGIV